VINHWFVTRPKRRLVLLVDALKAFMAVAQGEVWRGNRALHLLYEDALETAGVKAPGERRDQRAGGGRTYAAWLYAYGLWFEDSDGRVWPTFAGQDLLEGRQPMDILLYQLLNFQYPSPYSQSKGVKIHDRFHRIFPFRFLLKLLLEPRLGGILRQREIGLYVITRAENERSYDRIVEDIETDRTLGSSDANISALLGDGWQRHYTKRGNVGELYDVANTFICNLEFTGLIDRTDEPGTIKIRDGKEDIVRTLLSRQPTFLNSWDRPEVFQRKYGLGPHHLRDNRRFGQVRPITRGDAEAKKVVWTYYAITANEPLIQLDDRLYQRISEQTGVQLNRTREIIEGLGVAPSYEWFEERYIQLAYSGPEGAKAFEKSTAGIFGENGLGFKTEWIGTRPNSPDVLVLAIPENQDGYFGILDSKAYKDYNLPGDHQRRMFVEYIPRYRTLNYSGQTLQLKFFGYIAGGFQGDMASKLQRIADRSNVSGFAMSAKNVVKLVRKHRENPFTQEELLRIFNLNDEVCEAEFSSTGAVYEA
jgi:hypothetical protein